MTNDKDIIRAKALSLGFSHCGFAEPNFPEVIKDRYHQFVDEHRYAHLSYLRRYEPERMNPELLLPGVKTVIALVLNYYPVEILPEEDNFIISKYAYGKDHHLMLKERLSAFRSFLAEAFPGCSSRSFYDSGPVMEKLWARRCGIGWQGKNTVIITRDGGSFFFIGVVLTDLEVKPDIPGADHCGTCEKCLRACPTGALEKPYQLTISRCISYHTIENRGGIPEEMQGKFRDRIFGCDICQDVCPFNRFAKPHREPDFLPAPELVQWRKKDWLALQEVVFNRLFANSAVLRTGYRTFIRNMNL